MYSTFCEFCGKICEFCGKLLYGNNETGNFLTNLFWTGQFRAEKFGMSYVLCSDNMKPLFAFLLLILSTTFFPQTARATTALASIELHERKERFSERKMRKIHRILKRAGFQHPPSSLADRLLWMGLFGLGLAFCISLFSIPVSGILAAAAVACLAVGAVFKLSSI